MKLGKNDSKCSKCGNDQGNTIIYEDYDNITYRCSNCGCEFVRWDSEPELYNVSWDDFGCDDEYIPTRGDF